MANGKPSTAANGRTINLDEIKAARSEKAGDPITVTFSGEEFTLPAEMPFEFVDRMAAGDLGGGAKALFGDQYDRFIALGPSMTDFTDLAERVSDLYGASLGDS